MTRSFPNRSSFFKIFLSLPLVFATVMGRAQCSAADKPTFGFAVDATNLASINNGIADASESTTVSLCDGGFYTVSGYVFSDANVLFRITAAPSGGVILFNNSFQAGNGIVTPNTLLSSAGTYSANLADPNVGGTVVQTLTPFRDLNNDGLLDAGDCAGETITTTYVVNPVPTWYKDGDGDLHASETTRSCTSPGTGWTLTPLPVDDCNDSDASNSGPAFGFSVNSTALANINNGTADPSESFALTLCDGDFYTTSGHFHSGTNNLYDVKVESTGGSIIYDNLTSPFSAVITAAQLSGTAGSHSLTLADPKVSGSFKQTITPFVDLNANGVMDAGDCAGDPIVFTLTVTVKLKWYRDFDGDHHAADTTESCASPGTGWTTTPLPVDDCNDNDPSNSGPTFGFNVNSTALLNINNGTADPSEYFALTLCDGDLYATSGHFHSGTNNLYDLKVENTGGAIIYDNLTSPFSTVVTAAQLSSTAGSHSLTLADPNVGGSFKQTITPFVDLNADGIMDAGDCVGDPIVFTFTVTSKLKWYKDFDGDHHAADTTMSCTSPGTGWTTTPLPVDDCNDNDPTNSGPTLNYNFNGIQVKNINNGHLDRCEFVLFTICDAGSYTVSGYIHSGPSNLYQVKSVSSGGTLLFNGIAAVTNQTVYTADEFSGFAGTYNVSLANPTKSGKLVQTITPFVDLNGNGIPDAGDCIGDPIVEIYTVTASTTWYRDQDGDGFGNPAIFVKSCTKPAGYVKNNFDCDDRKYPGKPCDVSVRMCHNGVSECVNPRDILKNLNKGWTLGQCPASSCGTGETVMCHDGKAECVKNKDVSKKLCEAGQHWKLGSCSGNIASRTALGGPQTLIAANEKDQFLPQKYKLSSYPNPFSGSGNIQYELPFDSKVSVKVYDVTGRPIATLVNEDKKAGIYTVKFDGSRWGKGSFYYRIEAVSKTGKFEQTNKMIQLQQ